METNPTRMFYADEALAEAKAAHAAQKRQAALEFHGLDLTSRAQALDEAELADAARAEALGKLPAARQEAERLRRRINIDFTPARNERCKAWRKAKDRADELEVLSREFGHYFNRANACRYRADLLP